MEQLNLNLPQLPSAVLTQLLKPTPCDLQQSEAELLYSGENWILHYREAGKHFYKYLSPTALRIAFSSQPLDSGWLPFQG